MINLTFLPYFVSIVLSQIPGTWKHRHLLILKWTIFLQCVCPERKNVKNISNWGPSKIIEWRIRRLLKATYWSIHFVLQWFAAEVINMLPRPKDGVYYLIADSSWAEKRGKKNNVTQKGKKHSKSNHCFGIRFIAMCLCWDGYRIPVDFRIILPKTHKNYKKENELFQEMYQNFTPPHGAKAIIALADSAYSSAENLKMVQKRNKVDSNCEWYFVFAIARTWKTEDNKSLKNLVNHLPRNLFKRTRIEPLNQNGKRKTFWYFSKNLCLRHIGDVTIILSKKGRNLGPKNTKLIVTNLPNAKAKQVLEIYQIRWNVEILFWELKSGLGLGEYQVHKNEKVVEKSIGIPIVAYLFLILVRKEDITPHRSWSIMKLQNNLKLEVIKTQIKKNMASEFKNAA